LSYYYTNIVPMGYVFNIFRKTGKSPDDECKVNMTCYEELYAKIYEIIQKSSLSYLLTGVISMLSEFFLEPVRELCPFRNEKVGKQNQIFGNLRRIASLFDENLRAGSLVGFLIKVTQVVPLRGI